MRNLRQVAGPGAPRQFSLAGCPLTIGRQPGTAVHLDLPAVSRQHARITCEDGLYYLEDLGSHNGTQVNGVPLHGKVELRGQDRITISSFELVVEVPSASDAGVVIRAELSIHAADTELYRLDAGTKLQAVLGIANQLAQNLDLDDLLPRVLDHLLTLFLKADRGLILTQARSASDGTVPSLALRACGGSDDLVVRALRTREPDARSGPVYSRSVVRRVLAEGVGIVAADFGTAAAASTLLAAGIRSFVCVPLKGRDGRPLGVLQLDHAGHGVEFTREDLHLLTAVSLQVSVVLENAALHARLLENERIKRDLALARLSQMVAGVAHEINNPLAFLRNNVAVLERDIGALRELLNKYQQAEPAMAERCPEVVQQLRACAEEIDLPATVQDIDDVLGRSRDGLKRIQAIVQGLRDFARLDESERDEVDLNPGIESTIRTMRGLAEKQQVELLLEPGSLPRLACQPAKIHQVVFNLVANAIDACTPGGKVTVRTCAAADAVEVHVLDTGCGIDPAIRDKIFDPFFTTKPLGKGVGLGLSLSYGIVQDHGGTIEVESTPGQGAHFTVRLPLPSPLSP